jgi:adenine-specific DNA-methyltransferase
MATKKKAIKGPTRVDAITHGDKRTNLPTADAQEFMTEEAEAVPKLLYERDPSLDPQLVWKGKDEQDGVDLEVDAPPIYIQEKIDPRVLIENLRRTAEAGAPEPELTLFETFDGLGELDLVDFYRHEANWSNRMILGDSLQVMASLAEREALRGKVQMIYMDPPYGIKFGSNWQTSTRKPKVSDGTMSEASREVEVIKAFRDTWELGIHSYLRYLRDRFTVSKDLLTDTGSIFVQIGDENVHLVRSLLDEIFGSENFCVEVTFKKTTGTGSPNEVPKMLPAVFDRILWYAKDAKRVKYRQLFSQKALGGEGVSLYTRVQEADGSVRPLKKSEKDTGILPDGARAFGADNMTSSTGVDKTRFTVTVDGRLYKPDPGVWKTDREGMDRLLWARRVYAGEGKNLGYIRYVDDFPASPLTNLWTDTVGQNQYGGTKVYVVQTALKAVQRCILMATDPGDLVLDPTCGSGTTALVAEQWGRRWITIDTSRVALALTRQRLMGSRLPYYLLADSSEGREKEEELTGQPLPAGATSHDVRRGFIYDRVQHVTLKSIANNPDIVEGMAQAEIDKAIWRYAEYEPLLDKPHEDKRRVRVAGPMTVESLSPHRSLAFATDEPATERAGAADTSASSFEGTILANLERAGIQNGRRQERLELSVLEQHGGVFIQAVGTGENAEGQRIGISIGPQYGTVGPSFIKDAAREAIRAGDIDLLCVLGFAFDPQAIDKTDEFVSGDEGFDVTAERSLGRVPILLVRMNADLVMGEELKTTGAGNLFTVFGEPDIALKEDGADISVELRGVDVYDPTTGEVRSSSIDLIALWMIDTNYNGESFFVRHCYFTGGQDPYKRLKAALRADIDEEAWASLYATTSRPFPRPETGRVAVKVINDYGDEVMKVFEV